MHRPDDLDPTAEPTILPAELPLPDFHIPDLPLEIPEPGPDQVVTRALPHPGELNPRGFVITCARCQAKRDWLLLNVVAEVFVRCRCSHEWLERDLDVEAFEELFTHVDRVWGSLDEVVTGLGFDGTFAGTYW